ncbi:MAG: hypothetical protein KIT22_20215, partial [Verrucomicrobiae bacterium]|nr:hypothetical protein [Verrucomicrobiae bacterium]
MGRLTLELMRQAAPGIHGVFELISQAMIARDGCEDFAAFARQLSRQSPLRLSGQPQPRIHSGALCLNDPAIATHWLAVFHAGDRRLTDQRSREPGQ